MNNEIKLPDGFELLKPELYDQAFRQEDIKVLVWNGLDEEWHPGREFTQGTIIVPSRVVRAFGDRAFAVRSDRPIPKPEIKAPKGYELVPKEEWDVSPKDLEFKFLHESGWGNLHNDGRSLNNWHSHDPEFYKAFARPIKATDVIKEPVPPEGYEMVPESDFKTSITPVGYKDGVCWKYWSEIVQWAPLDTKGRTIEEFRTEFPKVRYFCRPIKKETPLVGSKEFAKEYRESLSKEDPYQKTYAGLKIDPYRVGQIFGITHPAHFQALKKVLRAGRSHKPLVQDIEEAIESLQRWLEMLKEDGK